MEECLVPLANLSDFFKWLHDTNFIVNMDDTAHECVWSHRLLKLFEVDQPCLELDWEISDFEALIL